MQPSHAGSHGQFGGDRRVESDRTWNITLVTDAGHPQVNGVVITWTYMQREPELLGHRLQVVQPSQARGLCPPGEPDLIHCIEPFRHVRSALEALAPDALHIATEGPLGFAARHIALKRGWQFTAPCHTRFLECLEARFGLPAALTCAVMRRFHRPPRQVLVATEAHKLDHVHVRAAVAKRTWSAIAYDLLSVLVPLSAQCPASASGRVRLAPAPAP